MIKTLLLSTYFLLMYEHMPDSPEDNGHVIGVRTYISKKTCSKAQKAYKKARKAAGYVIGEGVRKIIKANMELILERKATNEEINAAMREAGEEPHKMLMSKWLEIAGMTHTRTNCIMKPGGSECSLDFRYFRLKCVPSKDWHPMM